MEFRFIQDGFNPAAQNMALDEAVMKNCVAYGKPTLRFYRWKPSAVSIGYFQSLEQEVDTAKCRELGVDVVRRSTGGGAVFHDAELTYSFVCPVDAALTPKNILDSYRHICGGLIHGFRELGLMAAFVPLNDLVVNGKKVSGNAQTRREKTLLQHGTILIDVDVDKMFSLLKVPNEKIRDKLISDVKQRVTSINREAGKAYAYDEVAQAMKKGFERHFKATLVDEPFTAEERKLAGQIAAQKYSRPEWNGMR